VRILVNPKSSTTARLDCWSHFLTAHCGTTMPLVNDLVPIIGFEVAWGSRPNLTLMAHPRYFSQEYAVSPSVLLVAAEAISWRITSARLGGGRAKGFFHRTNF